MGGTVRGLPVLNLLDGNSTLKIDLTPGAQLGLVDWVIDGVNLLPAAGGGRSDYRQWFWYRVGATPEASLDSLPLSFAGTSDANFDGNPDTAFMRYTSAAGFKIELTVGLTGGTPGSKASDIGEIIKITNTNATSLAISFFQYVDFALGGQETVTFTNANTVRESGAFGAVQETVVTPSSTHRETLPFSATITKLNDGVFDNLIDNTTAGPGDITWAYQWDFVIAPGGSVLISKDKQAIVPEPSTWLLMTVAGALAGFFVRRKRTS
jgi:PEP-CTERM motif